MSRCMGKTNNLHVQNGSNCEADQRLSFRYTDGTIPLLSKSKISSLLLSSVTAWFMSDPVGTQIVGFLTHRLRYVATFLRILR